MVQVRHMLLVAFVFVVLGAFAFQVAAQEPEPPAVVPIRPVFTWAHPRTAIVNVFAGGAENFLQLPAEVDTPVVTVPAGQVFRLTAPYETVMHALTAGIATFKAEAFLIMDEGLPVLLDSDKATVVNFGPRIYNGTLNLDLRIDELGEHEVLLRMVTEVKPVGVQEVTVDEEDMTILVRVVAPQPATEDSQDAQLQNTQPAPTQPRPVEPLAARTVQVAQPRGEIVDDDNLAVNNFEQPHRQPIVVQRGDSLTFRAGPYEFVWFETATGTADVSLVIEERTSPTGPVMRLGAADETFPAVEGPARRRGALDVSVSFEEPGVHHVVAIIRSAMWTGDATAVRGSVVDEDEVHLRVLVVDRPETGSMAGQVIAADTLQPLPGVLVQAFVEDSGRPVVTTRTHEDGSYQFGELKPGSYVVQARPDRQNYLPEWYDDQPRRRLADPVQVHAGEVTTGIDFALTPGAAITGRVTAEAGPTDPIDGHPLGGILILVGVFEGTDSNEVVVGKTRTLEDGRYAVDKLPAGTYWVRAVDPEGTYRSEYWDDAPTLEQATPVTLAVGEWVENIDFALAAGDEGGISGLVIRQSRDVEPAVIVPLPGIVVTAFNAATGEGVGRAETGANGRYRIRGLPAGRYLVRAHDPHERYREEWWAEKASRDGADPVRVEAGAVTEGINFTLLPRNEVPTVLHFDPPATSVAQVGDAFEVSLAVENVEDLGNFEVTLTYNPEIVQVEGVELGAFLIDPDQDGRQYELLDPIIDNQVGQARFGVFSLGTAPGASGSGEVLRIRMVAHGPGETVLRLENVQILDTRAEPIRTRVEGGRVHVGECLAYDFDCDCDVDIVDVSKVARRWGTQAGDPEYDPRYDLDHDEDIDIVDVAIIAAAWGMSCEVPPPATTPGQTGLSLTQEVGLLATTVRVDAPASPVAVGEIVTATVLVEEAVDLKSFEFTMVFDPAILQVKTVNLGPFLSGALVLDPIIDAATGTVRFGAVDLGLSSGVSGTGPLATVTFLAKGAGTSPLELVDVKLVDSLEQEQVDVGVAGAALTVIGEEQLLPLIRR